MLTGPETGIDTYKNEVSSGTLGGRAESTQDRENLGVSEVCTEKKLAL